MKILFLTYSQSPYRVDFFTELGKYVDLTVCFEITIDKDKEKRNKDWYKKDANNFRSIFLKNKYIFGKHISNGVIKLLKQEQFDTIVIGGYNSLTAIITMHYLKRKKIPFFISTDGGFPNPSENILKKKLKKYLFSLGSYYLSTGKNANSYLEYYGVDKNKIFYYPFTNIKENEKISKIITKAEKDKLRKQLDMKEDFIFLFIGRFIHGKGIDLLINASLSLPGDVGIYIIGDKPNEEFLELTKNNSNIHFIDFKSKEELKNYFMVSDFFVLPTLSDVFGLVVVEALTYGLPVLTTDKCGAGLDLIKNDYNGYIIEHNNQEALSKQMSYILKHKNKIKKMKSNSLKSVANYTIEEEARAHYKVFNEVLKGKKI